MDHVLFWVVTIGFHIYTAAYLVGLAGWWHLLLEVVLRNGLLALIIYANLEYLIPVYAYHKKFYSYLAGILVCFLFYVLVKNTHDVFLTVYTGKTALPFWQYSFYNFSIALFYMAFSLALQLSKEWYFQRERLRMMEVEKLHTELEYLKAQINPHFLFNSLNTIFFQIEKTNMTARETLSKFSDMLRYQLYECNGDLISVEREIQYLRNYVDLQRLRKDDKYSIDLKATGTWNDAQVAPLMLMPLVENAFKYVSHFPGGDNRVSIQITGDLRELAVQVVNTKDTRVAPRTAGGIGLRNLRRRLELQYPGRHTLEIDDGKTVFDVRLTLQLGL
ncbi:MAG: histidine kinase [Cyclobacteriaceae bacterium]|nr:histidine kinase [Cyclobacteriaceae bacterium]